MAGASDSDDASELFWPGYVDAVTNLAINLLFVIAIMAIVVMTANLQISQMQPKKAGALDDVNTPPSAGKLADAKAKYQETLETVIKAQTVYKKVLDESEINPNIALRQAPTVVELELILQDLVGKLQKTMDSQKKEDFEAKKELIKLISDIEKLEKKLALVDKENQKLLSNKNLKSNISNNQVNDSSNQNARMDPKNILVPDDSSQPPQEINATQLVNKVTKGQSKLQDLKAGGIVVVFSNDVIELSETEIIELIKKLTVNGPVKGARWQLRVISPKGFSEATRIAYYRVNSLRNILLKNGALASDIEMRVVETEGDQANNARVLVRQMP